MLARLPARTVAIALALPLAAVAPSLIPATGVLSVPDSAAEHTIATAVLLAAFACGALVPRGALFGLVLAAVAEGAFRKWIANDVVAYLFKDFLALGIYAAVLPTLSRAEWRRPAWLVAPLAGLLALAVAYTTLSDSVGEAAIGLRGYAIYVPLLWVAPKLLDAPQQVARLLGLVIAIGVGESVLGALQSLTAGVWLNEVVPGALPAVVIVDGFAQLRPTGTFTSVAALAAFLIYAVLAAAGLLVAYRSRRATAAGVVGLALLSWGVIYTASRTVFLPSVVVVVAVSAYLVATSRRGAAVALVGALAVGYLALAYQPLVGGAVREGNDPRFLRNEVYTYIDAGGRVRTLEMSIHRGDARATAAVAARAAGSEPSTVPGIERPAGRLGALHVLGDKGVLGEGTGSLSQGSQYLLQGRPEGAESGYVKVAHELGWPGLALFVWFLAAMWVSTLRALRRREPSARWNAVVAFGATTFVPLLTLIAFTFDYPAVAILYYVFGGLAAAAPFRSHTVNVPSRATSAYPMRSAS